MADFDYLFSFYGLLLGLSVANVASGFGDMWRDRNAVRVGICAPLLAAVVLFGCMNIWLVYWRFRHGIEFDAWRMLAAAGVALPYIFISRAMFPSVGSATSLEDHYITNRRVILIALAISPIVSATSNLALSGGGYPGWAAPWIGARIAGPLLLIPFANPIIQRGGLAAILALLVIGLFR